MLNKSKTTFIALCIFFLAGSMAYAQQDTLKTASVQEKSLAIAGRMERELSLTETQTQQVVKLAIERLDDLKITGSNDASRFETVNQRSLKKLATILTKQQYAKYLELRAETKKQKDEYLKQDPSNVFSQEDLELDF